MAEKSVFTLVMEASLVEDKEEIKIMLEDILIKTMEGKECNNIMIAYGRGELSLSEATWKMTKIILENLG